jgi:glycosyltransferase involved in cell wall biosynthesis
MKTNHRVLILRSNPVSPDPRVEKEARCLASAGYSVSVLCWDRDGTFSPTEELAGGYVVQRIEIVAAYGTGLSNLPGLIRWQFALFRHLIKRRKNYDILHACDFDTVLPAVLMKLFFRKMVVYDIFDFYADHLRRTPGWIKNIIRQFDIRVINYVNGVILVDKARRVQIEEASPAHLAYVYNSPEDLCPTCCFPDEKSDTTFSITYVGLLQWERGLSNLIRVVKENPNFHLYIAGFGGDQKAIEESADKQSNIEYFGRVPYNQALLLSQKADLIWALYDPTIPNHQYASPNKLFEAMMLGKPVIVARDTNIDSVVREMNCGYIVEYSNFADLQNILKACAANPNDRAQKGRNARIAYEQRYSWKKMEEELLNLYQIISD